MHHELPIDTIVVDLDRTLSLTDLTLENIIGALSRNPFLFFKILIWGLRDRAHMKAQLTRHFIMDMSYIPFNQAVICYLEAERDRNKKIVLASASHQKIVDAVSDKLQLFDEAYGSAQDLNLKGAAKAQFLNNKFGKGGYAYIGDSTADLAVWADAKFGLIVNNSKSLLRRARRLNSDVHIFREATQSNSIKRVAWFKALRPHQWSKNALIFVPMIAGQVVGYENVLQTCLAFLIFSLTASSVYLLNDLLDLEVDRTHPRKHARMLPSGTLPLKFAIITAPSLLIAAFALSVMTMPIAFLAILILYYISTLAYSLFLKQKILIDVVTLGALYTFRILAGAAALSLETSHQLLGFSLFFFLSLAIVKRVSEIIDMIKLGEYQRKGRGYFDGDLNVIQSLGAAAGYGSIVFLMLYLSSETSQSLYASPTILWGVIPLMLYWISRMLLLANRGAIGDDPIVFASKDKTSLIIGALVSALILFADMLDVSIWYRT